MMKSIAEQPKGPESRPNAKNDLKSLPLPELETKLGSSPDGLSQTEARRRLEQYGYNEITEKSVNPFLKFLSYFWGPIPWMIEAAVILSALVRHWPDFFIILVLLLASAGVGFWEEYQAGNAIAALKAKLAIRARVRRDGKWGLAAARELVPGDIIRIRLGDIVPADAEAHTVSHFQRAVLKIGDYLIALAVVLVVMILVVALFRGDRMSTTLQFALVLTVATIPVAMPTVLSVTMAVGARVLAAKQAIVSRLAAIEELAGMDVLCSDKTGTLTQNKLTLGEPYCVAGIPPEQVILSASLASRAEDRDTIDLAVLSGLQNDRALKGFQAVHYRPFDPVHKRTEATVKPTDGPIFKVTKGAPQVILALAANAAQVNAAVERAIEEFAVRGFRSLGVARSDAQGQWQFLGVLPPFDPPREDSKATIASARKMGVNVKMVTGDQLAIARETAGQLGLGTNILDASGFGDTRHHETAQLAEPIEHADGFAQVFPEHKFHIVDVLQHRNHIVGMTGEPLNELA